MAYQLDITKPVIKYLEKLPSHIYLRLKKAILSLEENPRPHDCEKMSGKNAYRIRVGDYRNPNPKGSKESSSKTKRSNGASQAKQNRISIAGNIKNSNSKGSKEKQRKPKSFHSPLGVMGTIFYTFPTITTH